MNKPKFNIGQFVIVFSQRDKQKIVQGKVVSADCFYDKGEQGTWFYAIEVPSSDGVEEPERVYSYEIDTGDAKTKIIDLTKTK